MQALLSHRPEMLCLALDLKLDVSALFKQRDKGIIIPIHLVG